MQRLLKARCFADTLATWGFYRSDKHPELRCLIFWRSHRCFPSRTATTSEAASRSSWSNGKPSSPSRLMFASIPLLQKRRISPPLTVFLSSSRLVWNLLAFVFFSYSTVLRQQVTAPGWSPFCLGLLPHEISSSRSSIHACGYFQPCSAATKTVVFEPSKVAT